MTAAETSAGQFQSAPRSVERGDRSSALTRGPSACFNPRPAQSSGATEARGIAATCMFQSAPRSVERGDLARPTHADVPCFNPRPAQSSGATADVPTRQRLCACFNPRPAQSSGATRNRRDVWQAELVSIRAPLSRAGRPVKCRRSTTSMFQSAPRSVERGDRQLRGRRSTSFNPRPAQSSGATAHDAPSVRRPRMFQSAPRSVERGDSRAGRSARRRSGFNPRPAQSSGATLRASTLRSAKPCFNPRPAQSSGATTRCPSALTQRFNPRPAQSSGATSCRELRSDAAVFQSAPRSVERGDPARGAMYSSAMFQSAPRSSSGATGCSRPVASTVDVSIRAPLSRAGRPGTRGGRRKASIVVSIRAPLSRAGRPDCQFEAANSRVSIRAPLSRAGRPAECSTHWAVDRFQSAPRSVERGDCLGREARRTFLFQSAPRSVERGDTAVEYCEARPSFNPRPAQSSGATTPMDHEHADNSFNPRPAQSSGATYVGHAPTHRSVSIRAPLSRAGRPRCSAQ